MKLLSTTPVFLVADIAATMRWYRHTFGIMSKDDIQIFLQQLEGYEKPDPYENREGGVWNVYVQMEGVREFFETVSTLGDVTMVERLRRQPYGQIEFAIKDPNGYVLVFAERT
jgi:uncharacterized glyoxalase superfamily protein PhnB